MQVNYCKRLSEAKRHGRKMLASVSADNLQAKHGAYAGNLHAPGSMRTAATSMPRSRKSVKNSSVRTGLYLCREDRHPEACQQPSPQPAEALAGATISDCSRQNIEEAFHDIERKSPA